jgi:hypothetical protein
MNEKQNVKQTDEQKTKRIIEQLKKLAEQPEVTTKQFYPVFEKMVDACMHARTQWVKMLALSKQIVSKLVQ